MSRYAPPARERSPARYDRRPSTYGAGSSYRGTGESATPIDRDPPRGPRADSFRGGYPYAPPARGRGAGAFPARSADTWNRDRDRDRDRERDARPPQSYRAREDDRPDWTRRDRDLGPPDRPPVAARDTRPYPPRERSASPVRARRDSRESLPPLASRQSDSVASFRGGLGRGRGRGDWDRMRGRSTFVGDRERERDLFSNRSPSRDGTWRDREYDRGRASGPEADRPDRFDRRERSRERRDHDIWQRDPSPPRAGSGPAARAPSPAHSAGHYGPADRTTKMDYEMTRRPSAVTTTSAPGREPRRDEQTDYFVRNELRRESSHSSLYQPPAPQSSATAGLDYGPPPSAPAVTPSEKPPTVQSKPTKPVSPAVTAPPFQPPSGPKADRVPSNTSSAPKPPVSSEPLRTELALQSSRPVPTGSPPELFPKKMEQKPEPRPSITQTPDKTMPPNVPSGPRSSFGSSFRSRPPLSESGTSFLTPKQSPSDSRGPAIPTGPRSDRERENMRDVREGREGPWPPTQPGGSSRSWISPEYNRAKPSIMSPINRDRPAFAPTGPRSQSILPPSGDKARPFQPSIMAGSTPAAPSSKAGSVEGGRSLGALSKERGPSEDVDMSLPVSSDEEADEDEFDEDDFAASEEKFAKERKALEARKPPPLLHDMVLRGLLVKMQFLSMIASKVAVETVESKAEADEPMKGLEHAQIGLPSPEELSEEQEKPEVKHPQPRGRPLREPPVNPIPTPPVEDLPYLRKQNSQPTVFDDSDDEVQHESITTHIRQEFEREAFDWQDELQEMSTEYRKQYAAWRDDLVSLHQPVRDPQLSPAPVSPAPSAAPSVTPSANHERTRGGRNTTEADLQAAIALSQQTMKEEEERREREAASSSVPNFDHEAVVPAMIKPTDTELSQFEDTNRLIPPELALEVFAYLPPEDDFTEEEQLAFIQGYCQTPKKWGKIAEGLPGRTYQDCITHYYLTKGEAKYKDIWRRNQPKRRRGRNATKPRSTALMSELAYRAGEDAAVAVTDTGRPRRAAAPTFGDTAADSDPSTMAPAAKRLAVSGKEATPDGTVKPGRGRKPGTKVRRTKAQIAADNAAAAQAAQSNALHPANLAEASPQKLIAQRERSRTLLRAGDNGIPKTDLGQGLDMPKLAEPEMPQYGLPDTDRLVPPATNHTPNQPTSYWSVPEQQKFPQLIAYYGRDFPAVADFMRTKTSTMIKNHYNRQIAEGKLDLEELAKAAELKRANNEPMGPPPSPAIQTKRRYEATPSTASPQHGRIVPEQHVPEPEPTSVPPKAGYTEDFPSNTVQRTFAGEIVAKARTGRDLLQEPPVVQAKPEESQRPTGLAHKPLVGPRSGFFKEENPAFGMPHQVRSRDNSPHQHPLRPGEHRFGDLGQSVPAGSPRQLNLGPARDLGGLASHPPASTSIPNSSLQSDRFGLPQQHSRNGSMGGVTSASLDQARDLAALRQMDLVPRQYSMVPPQTATPPPASSAPLRRTESGHGHGSAPPPEPPKPTPAKRSNINSLLNDDPPEPKPVKRSSFDSQKRAAMMSPQTVPHHGSPFDPSRNPFRLDGSPGDLDRNIRTPLSSLGPHPLREQQQPGYPSAQTPTPNEDWLGRYDPRPQSGLGEQRSLHQSPRTAHYSVVPPSTGGSNLRMEAPRSLDPAHPDHRRSILGGLSHPGPNPSPPPQQQMSSYRSLAGSGQQVHSRVSSANYAHGQSSQGPPHQLQHALAGPPSHPQSASSTPVSSLQHGRPSLDLGAQQRQTIQQHMAHLQQQQRDPPPSYRDRDHEQALQRQRELEAQQQQMRAPDRERDIYGGYRRDVNLGYGGAPPREQDTQPPAHGHQQQPPPQQQHPHHPHQPPHLSAQPAGPGQPRPYGYPPEPVQRSYTPQPPPPQHPPYQPSHTPGPPSQIHHHHHLQGGQPKAQMQGPAPPPGVHATNHGTYGHGHSHYRTISSDERRYE